MQSQLRIAHFRAARAVILPQRRLLATPPGIPPTPPPPSGAAPVRPVVVVNSPPITPGSSTLPAEPLIPPTASGTLPPPPPPPPPRKPRHFFRRFLLYSTLSVLTFYPLSGFLSTKSETYRDFFVSTFPLGETVADYADDHAWESFGVGTMSKKAVEGWQKVTGDPTPQATGQKVESRAKEAQRDAEAKAIQAKREAEVRGSQLKRDAEAKAAQVKKDAQAKAQEAEKELKTAAERAKKGGKEALASAQKKADEAKTNVKAAADKAQTEAVNLKDRVVAATHDAAEKAKTLAKGAKDKVVEAASSVPFNASEGVEGIVREAERALNKGEAKVAETAAAVKDAVTPVGGPRVLPDTQRPRELRPETVTPAKPTFDGQEKYAGPPLPLGFEPPPGYYIPPPPKTAGPAVPAAPVLPLLAPKVKDFGTDEPIIAQLASTIDSLTTSLSAPGSGPSTNASGILSKAQDDLTALSTRLAEIKKVEKAKLEKSIGDKAKEFETTLRNVEASKAQSEAGIREQWQKERNTMVESWKKDMEKELESQREGIEKRLHEEVISQGIELQRRWLRSIKAQVESERGGRLAKLDTLTTSLKQLERITLDNSATLDDNVRLHKIWSALRAVQSKADSGDASFTEELRVLKSLSTAESTEKTVVSSALGSLETSGVAQTGVKSLASLSSWFTTSVSPRIHSAGLVPSPESAGVASHVASMALSKLMFRPQPGPVRGEDVSAVLARAEWCLAEKDLDGAAREVNRLSGWPGLLAKDWLREARRALEVRQALEVVATEATLGSLLLV